MPKQCWLVKQEPQAYSWASFARDQRTAWTGIRNFQARNYLRAMKRGDAVLFYHSGGEKQIVGLARVIREGYPDPTAAEGDWSAADFEARKPLKRPVPLSMMKADTALKNMALMRQTRLSVTPVTRAEFDRLLELSETRP
jgi:predicted RNA-binding protein with PUA-like domain